MPSDSASVCGLPSSVMEGVLAKQALQDSGAIGLHRSGKHMEKAPNRTHSKHHPTSGNHFDYCPKRSRLSHPK